jgi:hypothetical protein
MRLKKDPRAPRTQSSLKLKSLLCAQEQAKLMSNDENAIALGSLAELIAKCGAAMCIGALCTAFVFDYTLWLIVDPRMLSYFDLVDHIQTAVQIFGIGSIALAAAWILMFVVVYAGFATDRVDDFWKVATALLLFILCLLVLGILTSGSGNEFDRATITLMSAGLVVMLTLGFVLHRSRSAKSDSVPSHRPFTLRRAVWSAVPLCIFLTMAGAVLSAWSIEDSEAAGDVVRLEHDPPLSGKVIRAVSRGVIVRDNKGGGVVFTPKEQIRRIDHRVPPGQTS